VKDIAIIGACRTPIGSFGGALAGVSAASLGALVIKEALSRARVNPTTVDDVLMGCVLQAGAGMNVARQAAIAAGLPVSVPAATINRVCGSGLQTVVQAADALHTGFAKVIVAGGTESMSRAPFLMTTARWGQRLGHGEVVDAILTEGLTCAIASCHMGVTAEEIARRFGIGRAEQDAFAAASQHRALAAIEGGEFDAEIVAVEAPGRKGTVLVTRDEHPRPGTTVETLAALRPAFEKSGTVTAGNASGLNDGAAALVVTTTERARAMGTEPLAHVLSYAITGVEPAVMGMGPVSAVRLALDRAGLRLADVALFELNEAFAVQSLAVVRELGIDTSRVNVHGGAIALGHPIGASGARVLTTLIYALRARGGGLGVAALCIGGGMGIALVVRVDG
jgi:acetyl-CoA C-acetyltransferase